MNLLPSRFGVVVRQNPSADMRGVSCAVHATFRYEPPEPALELQVRH
jgi:hypothetical protein